MEAAAPRSSTVTTVENVMLLSYQEPFVEVRPPALPFFTPMEQASCQLPGGLPLPLLRAQRELVVPGKAINRPLPAVQDAGAAAVDALWSLQYMAPGALCGAAGPVEELPVGGQQAQQGQAASREGELI